MGVRLVSMGASLVLIAVACSSGSEGVDGGAGGAQPEGETAMPMVDARGPADGEPEETAHAAAEEAAPEPASTPAPRSQDDPTPDVHTQTEDEGLDCVSRPGQDGPPPPTLSGPAEPGSYTYSVDGTWRLSGDQEREGDLPEEGTRTRTEAQDRTGETYRYQEVRRGGGDGERTTTLRASPQSVRLERWVSEGRGERREFEPTPPVTTLQLPLEKGTAWESTGTDGQTTLTIRAEVVRTDTIVVCGSSYPAWVVEGWTTIVAGAFKVEAHGRTWLATSLGGLALRSETESTTTFQGGRLTTEATRALTSIAPR